MLYLETLDLGMSDQKEDLLKSVITPAPPLDCRVGTECKFTLSTRTTAGLNLPHGGLAIAIKKAAGQQVIPCVDAMTGSYICTFPELWIGSATEFDFVVSADTEEFVPLRTVRAAGRCLSRPSTAHLL